MPHIENGRAEDEIGAAVFVICVSDRKNPVSMRFCARLMVLFCFGMNTSTWAWCITTFPKTIWCDEIFTRAESTTQRFFLVSHSLRLLCISFFSFWFVSIRLSLTYGEKERERKETMGLVLRVHNILRMLTAFRKGNLIIGFQYYKRFLFRGQQSKSIL